MPTYVKCLKMLSYYYFNLPFCLIVWGTRPDDYSWVYAQGSLILAPWGPYSLLEIKPRWTEFLASNLIKTSNLNRVY